MNKKGFTLVELLIVIAILAVLAVAVVVVLNPAELLRQSRDSRRLSDMRAINSSIALFLTDRSDIAWTTTHNCTVGTTSPMTGSCVQNQLTNVTGSGWVNLDFTASTAGSPLSNLPLDPTNNATFYYAFKNLTNQTYELNAKMESVKFATTSATEVVSAAKDGGNNPTWYETGNYPGLNL